MKADAKWIVMPALVVAALGAGVAQSKECKGVSFPDQAQVDGTSLSLNGVGLRQATAFTYAHAYPASQVPTVSRLSIPHSRDLSWVTLPK